MFQKCGNTRLTKIVALTNFLCDCVSKLLAYVHTLYLYGVYVATHWCNEGGTNILSLRKAQKNYVLFGACEERWIEM